MLEHGRGEAGEGPEEDAVMAVDRAPAGPAELAVGAGAGEEGSGEVKRGRTSTVLERNSRVLPSGTQEVRAYCAARTLYSVWSFLFFEDTVPSVLGGAPPGRDQSR